MSHKTTDRDVGVKEAARRLGVPPERCYAFEDGELGLQSARAAGMVAIDVRPIYPQRSR